MIFGNVKGRKVLAFQGRFHLYEGYKVEEVVFGVRVAGLLGVKNLIVTNAAGGISQFLSPGDLMVIKTISIFLVKIQQLVRMLSILVKDF